MAPRFIYFDLGNVLLKFSHHRAARQMAEVAGITPERVWDIVFSSDLEHRYERGELSGEEFYEEFCRKAGTHPDKQALRHAAADIFELNVPVVPLVTSLRSAGHQLGILSNTNEAHWGFVSDGRYGLIPRAFNTFSLSYEIGAMKPEAGIYEAAAERAGAAPREIFFVDDRPENVRGAQAAGFEAVLFTTARQLAADLHSQGLPFN